MFAVLHEQHECGDGVAADGLAFAARCLSHQLHVENVVLTVL